MGSLTQELTGTGLERITSVRRRVRPFGATAAVAVIFVAAGGAFATYEVWGRAKAAHATAVRADAELVLTRQRAQEAESKAAAAEKALTEEKAAHASEVSKLEADNAALADENKKVAEKAMKSDAMASELQKTVGKEEGELEEAQGRLTLNLVDRVLFSTGKADLTPGGKRVLAKVGEVLKKHPDRMIWIIGHTDDVPIKTAEFPSNWELSTARALAVVHYLVEEVKVDPRHVAAAGMGPYRPASRSSRAKNRRIELVLFPAAVKYVKP
jgi:chemotaxis protein MotB